MTTIDITIEKLVYGGEGLAHHNGATIFVPFVLPAECVAATPIEQKKKFVRARLERLVVPSPERIPARCPHFGVCGGCHYQHVPDDRQLEYKSEILRETLRRIGRIEWSGPIAVHSEQPWGYRNRAQWKIRPHGNSPLQEADGAKLEIGYFRAGSAALCAVDDCPILSPPLLNALLSLRDALAAGALPRELREIEAFADARSSHLLLTVTFAGFPSRVRELAETFRSLLPNLKSLLFFDPSHDRMELFGPGFLEYELGGRKYRVGHFSFFQVNTFLTEELIREVVDREEGGGLALDLFAGVGLFSVPLADRFTRVIAVESNPAATRDLESNARGHNGIEVRTAEVESFLEKWKETPELILLDPPRAGLTPGAVGRLARLSPARITYVSCEPPTLARDLKAFRDAGYALSEVHLFDLFPQTFHMETVVRLRRRE
jgi:23S rRNA (uracil1939-C5)-methyltransferase